MVQIITQCSGKYLNTTPIQNIVVSLISTNQHWRKIKLSLRQELQ